MQQIIREEIVKLQPKGILTIPKKFRENLFDENGLVKVKKEGRKLIIEPVRTLSYPVRSYTDGELADFFAEDKKESKILKKKGLLK